MNNLASTALIEAKLLIRAADCVMASILVEGLPNTVLVQLVGTPLGQARWFSLYCVYREDTMTFDAIYRFALPTESDECASTLEDSLRQYLLADDIHAEVLAPLIQDVAMHFGR